MGAGDFEYVKASIRAAFGSLKAFEEHHGLAVDSVSDWGRGKTSRRVHDAMPTGKPGINLASWAMGAACGAAGILLILSLITLVERVIARG